MKKNPNYFNKDHEIGTNVYMSCFDSYQEDEHTIPRTEKELFFKKRSIKGQRNLDNDYTEDFRERKKEMNY